MASASVFTLQRLLCVAGGDHAHQLCRPQCLPVEHLQQWRAEEGGGLPRAAVTSDHTLRGLCHHPATSRPFLIRIILNQNQKRSLALQLADHFKQL